MKAKKLIVGDHLYHAIHDEETGLIYAFTYPDYRDRAMEEGAEAIRRDYAGIALHDATERLEDYE